MKHELSDAVSECVQAARKLAIAEVDLQKSEGRLEAAEA